MVIYDNGFIDAVSFMRLGDFLALQEFRDTLLKSPNRTGMSGFKIRLVTFASFVFFFFSCYFLLDNVFAKGVLHAAKLRPRAFATVGDNSLGETGQSIAVKYGKWRNPIFLRSWLRKSDDGKYLINSSCTVK